MKKFTLNVKGYECYIPVWFEKDCTKEEFELAVKESIHECLPTLIRSGDYIDGSDLIDEVVTAMVKKGFSIIKPELEISLQGECYYGYSSHIEEEKPDAIFDKDWESILDNNKKIKREHRTIVELSDDV